MNWDDFRLFLAIARSGRLSSAASIIGQDATTISRRLKRLEQALNRRLFEISAAGHLLTDEGQQLLLQVERMEAAVLGSQRVGSEGSEITGTIRLSASEGFGSRIIARNLAGFTARHPRVEIDLIASSGFLNPSRREADLAVMLARPKTGPLIARKLTDYRLGLYATRLYLATAHPLATPADLLRHTLVGYVPDQIYAPELRYLAEIDRRLEPTIRSSSINAQAEIVASGAGCGVLPCFIADATPGLVRVLPSAVDIRRTLWLVVHRDLRGIARIDTFMDWIVARTAALEAEMSGRVGLA